MTPELRGLTLRSNAEAFTLGNAITFKLDFLSQARQMAAPEIHSMTIEFRGTVSGVTGGALGRDAAKLFDTVRLKDTEEILNASGAALRVLEQIEYGDLQIDPADLASASTTATYVYRLRVPFVPQRAERPRDFALQLASFLEGGELIIQTPAAVPTGWAAVQADWKVRVFMHVIDGRVPELKARRRIKEEALTQQEFDYQINGFLRSAVITSKLTTTGYVDLSAYSVLYSRTLRTPPSYEVHMLQDEYRRTAPHNVSVTRDEFVRTAPGAIALCVPRKEQKTGQMIDTKSLHLDLLAPATAGMRMVTDVLIDRNAEMSALAAGYSSPGELQQAIAKFGVVVGKSDNYPASEANAALSRKLPIRIKPGTNK